MKFNILLIGHEGVGKDTGAKILEEIFKKRNLSFLTLAFGEPVKSVSCGLLGINHDQLERGKRLNDTINISFGRCSKKMTYREFIIKIGETLRGRFGKDFFVNEIVKSIEKENPDIAIVSDTRYKIEYDGLNKMEDRTTITIWIKSNLPSKSKVNKYELKQLPIDITVRNDKGEKEKFRTSLEKIVSDMKDFTGNNRNS